MSHHDVTAQLHDVIATIVKLEAEQQAIFADDQVTAEENPRLQEIHHELARLWDMRRRLEAARNAGLDQVPVAPPADPENMLQ